MLFRIIMITAKYIIDIYEEWIKSGKSGRILFSVYQNPGSSDFLDMIKIRKERGSEFPVIRFVADAKYKNVYVSDAYLATHEDICKVLGFSLDAIKTPWLYYGVGSLKDGSAKANRGGVLDMTIRSVDFKLRPDLKNWCESTLSYKWTFVDKYLPGFSSVVELNKIEFEKRLKS